MASVDRPISVVLQDIVRNIQDIVRAEVRLAKTEVGEELGKARSAGVLVGTGAVTAVFAALFLLLASVAALTLVMPQWAAALVVAAVLGLKENAQWARQLTK